MSDIGGGFNVGSAYVSILPDLERFRADLLAGLEQATAGIQKTIEVRLDTTGLPTALTDKLLSDRTIQVTAQAAGVPAVEATLDQATRDRTVEITAQAAGIPAVEEAVDKVVRPRSIDIAPQIGQLRLFAVEGALDKAAGPRTVEITPQIEQLRLFAVEEAIDKVVRPRSIDITAELLDMDSTIAQLRAVKGAMALGGASGTTFDPAVKAQLDKLIQQSSMNVSESPALAALLGGNLSPGQASILGQRFTELAGLMSTLRGMGGGGGDSGGGGGGFLDRMGLNKIPIPKFAQNQGLVPGWVARRLTGTDVEGQALAGLGVPGGAAAGIAATLPLTLSLATGLFTSIVGLTTFAAAASQTVSGLVQGTQAVSKAQSAVGQAIPGTLQYAQALTGVSAAWAGIAPAIAPGVRAIEAVMQNFGQGPVGQRVQSFIVGWTQTFGQMLLGKNGVADPLILATMRALNSIFESLSSHTGVLQHFFAGMARSIGPALQGIFDIVKAFGSLFSVLAQAGVGGEGLFVIAQAIKTLADLLANPVIMGAIQGVVMADRIILGFIDKAVQYLGDVLHLFGLFHGAGTMVRNIVSGALVGGLGLLISNAVLARLGVGAAGALEGAAAGRSLLNRLSFGMLGRNAGSAAGADAVTAAATRLAAAGTEAAGAVTTAGDVFAATVTEAATAVATKQVATTTATTTEQVLAQDLTVGAEAGLGVGVAKQLAEKGIGTVGADVTATGTEDFLTKWMGRTGGVLGRLVGRIFPEAVAEGGFAAMAGPLATVAALTQLLGVATNWSLHGFQQFQLPSGQKLYIPPGGQPYVEGPLGGKLKVPYSELAKMLPPQDTAFQPRGYVSAQALQSEVLQIEHFRRYGLAPTTLQGELRARQEATAFAQQVNQTARTALGINFLPGSQEYAFFLQQVENLGKQLNIGRGSALGLASAIDQSARSMGYAVPDVQTFSKLTAGFSKGVDNFFTAGFNRFNLAQYSDPLLRGANSITEGLGRINHNLLAQANAAGNAVDLLHKAFGRHVASMSELSALAQQYPGSLKVLADAPIGAARHAATVWQYYLDSMAVAAHAWRAPEILSQQLKAGFTENAPANLEAAFQYMLAHPASVGTVRAGSVLGKQIVEGINSSIPAVRREALLVAKAFNIATPLELQAKHDAESWTYQFHQALQADLPHLHQFAAQARKAIAGAVPAPTAAGRVLAERQAAGQIFTGSEGRIVQDAARHMHSLANAINRGEPGASNLASDFHNMAHSANGLGDVSSAMHNIASHAVEAVGHVGGATTQLENFGTQGKQAVDRVGTAFQGIPHKVGAMAPAVENSTRVSNQSLDTVPHHSKGVADSFHQVADKARSQFGAAAHSVGGLVSQLNNAVNAVHTLSGARIRIPVSYSTPSLPNIPNVYTHNPHFAHFQHGGLVPGFAGEPVSAIVHGGEFVLTRDQYESAKTMRGHRDGPLMQVNNPIFHEGTDLDALAKRFEFSVLMRDL